VGGVVRKSTPQATARGGIYKEKLEAVGCGPENTGLTSGEQIHRHKEITWESTVFFIDFN
jgi:hypothetical protein